MYMSSSRPDGLRGRAPRRASTGGLRESSHGAPKAEFWLSFLSLAGTVILLLVSTEWLLLLSAQLSAQLSAHGFGAAFGARIGVLASSTNEHQNVKNRACIHWLCFVKSNTCCILYLAHMFFSKAHHQHAQSNVAVECSRGRNNFADNFQIVGAHA